MVVAKRAYFKGLVDGKIRDRGFVRGWRFDALRGVKSCFSKRGLKGWKSRKGQVCNSFTNSIVYPMDENQIAMKINPCLNSAGRISLAEIALQALEASPESKLAARELLS